MGSFDELIITYQYNYYNTTRIEKMTSNFDGQGRLDFKVEIYIYWQKSDQILRDPQIYMKLSELLYPVRATQPPNSGNLWGVSLTNLTNI